MKRKSIAVLVFMLMLLNLIVTEIPVYATEYIEELVTIEESKEAEESKAEESKTEESKTEESKTEESKTEELKTEESKTEEPKTEESKTEEPKMEETKTEEFQTKKLQTKDLANTPALMAVRPDDVDLTSSETTMNKIDESKDRYEMPSNTSYVILKQAHGTIVVWSTEAVNNESSVKEQLLNMAKTADGSIKGDETVVFISGNESFDLGKQLGQNNWGVYDFKVTESGEVILTCDADKISHIDYVTSKSEPNLDTEPKPDTEPAPAPDLKPSSDLQSEPNHESYTIPTSDSSTEFTPEAIPALDENTELNNSYVIPKTGENNTYIIMACIVFVISLLCPIWVKCKR